MPTAVVAAVGVLGAPLGLLWALVAPGVQVEQAVNGPVLTDPEPEQFIAADGWFTLLGLGFGALVAITVWLVVPRLRGPVGLLAVGCGAIGAALLAWWLGRHIGLADYRELVRSAAVGETFTKPADLRAGGFSRLFGVVPVVRGDLLVPALGAVVTYTLLAGWSAYPSLRPEPDDVTAGPVGAADAGPGFSAAQVSSEPAGPPGRPAAPAPPAPGAAAPPPA